MRLPLPLGLAAALFPCASGPSIAAALSERTFTAMSTEGVAHTLPADSFAVQAWLAEVRALDADDDALVARSRRLADRLEAGAALDWRRACDTYHDPSTGEAVHDPVGPEQEAMIGRGLMDVTPLGPREAAVAILCSMGAYQGSWVLVHVEGDEVALVRTVQLSEAYQPTAFETATFGEPLFEPGSRSFTTFVKSRGMGDCGAFTRYRLGAGGRAETLEVRARGCGDEVPDELPPPEAWPVVYPR